MWRCRKRSVDGHRTKPVLTEVYEARFSAPRLSRLLIETLAEDPGLVALWTTMAVGLITLVSPISAVAVCHYRSF